MKRLAENFVQKAFLVFEKFSFEVNTCPKNVFLALSPTVLKFFSVVAYSAYNFLGL
jgi:hypothetical protein